jgi:hypothetical protein
VVRDDASINPAATERSRQAFRRKIESDRAKSITDLAEQEGVTDAYVCRLLPLTCLAPDIVEAILDGRQPKGLRLAEMLCNGPTGWEERVHAGRLAEPDGGSDTLVYVYLWRCKSTEQQRVQPQTLAATSQTSRSFVAC